jgi:hypothetical protein
MLMASPSDWPRARARLQGVPGTVNTIDWTRLLRPSVGQQLTCTASRFLAHPGNISRESGAWRSDGAQAGEAVADRGEGSGGACGAGWGDVRIGGGPAAWVSVPAVLSWRNRFLDAGRQSLADRVPGGPEQERRVGGGAAAAVGERPAEDGAGGGDGAAADVAEGRRVHRPGPFSDLEALRATADLPVSRFARLAGIPRRTYHRRLARLRDGEPVKGPWPSPAVDEVEAVAAKYAEA